MAHFSLSTFLDVGCHGYIDATSWQVAKDVNFTDIIDESLHDTTNIWNWVSPLPNGSGGCYGDLPEVHLRVKVHILESSSPWFYVGYMNQNDQTFIITENHQIVDTVNSLTAGIL